SPPGTKTAWRITKPEVGVQDEAIDTVIAAVEQVGVVVGEFIGGHRQHTIRAQFGRSTARRATFSEPGLRKSVESCFGNSYPRLPGFAASSRRSPRPLRPTAPPRNWCARSVAPPPYKPRQTNAPFPAHSCRTVVSSSCRLCSCPGNTPPCEKSRRRHSTRSRIHRHSS